MPRSPSKRKKPPLRGTSSDRGNLRLLMSEYLEWMRVQAYADGSIEFRGHMLGYFAVWCEERGIFRASEVTRAILERYQRHLFYYRKSGGLPLGLSTQYNRINILRAFFRWATRQNHILYNPASELEMPRRGTRLPRDVLTTQEAEAVLAQPNLSTLLGVRDRAMMEVLYSTGMRRRELCNLALYDIDPNRGTVMIREGKGRKDRVVPIGSRALSWVDKYLQEIRPKLAMAPDDGSIFLSAEGVGIAPPTLTQLVHDYVEGAKTGKKGSCHIFRHTMATLMLEGGADIRFIQQMLGHEELTSTQIYTHVSITQLKQIHTATHPGAELHRPGKPAHLAPLDPEATSALLSVLEHEAEEEEADPHTQST